MSPAGENGHGEEVVVPDEVSGPGQPRASRRSRPSERPDRRAIFAMAAGLSSMAFLVVVPILPIMLVLAFTGIYLGRKVMKEIGHDESRAKERSRAKFGLVGGITTLALFVVLIIVLWFVYEPPNKASQAPDDKTTATSTPAG